MDLMKGGVMSSIARHMEVRRDFGGVVSLGIISFDFMGFGGGCIMEAVDEATERLMPGRMCGIRKVVLLVKGSEVALMWEMYSFGSWDDMNAYLRKYPGDQRWVWKDFGREGRSQW